MDALTARDIANRQRYERTMKHPLLWECTECKKRWFSQIARVYSECCHEPIGAVVAACPDCRRSIVGVTVGMKCEHCGSERVLIEPDQFPYMSQQEFERACESGRWQEVNNDQR